MTGIIFTGTVAGSDETGNWFQIHRLPGHDYRPLTVYIDGVATVTIQGRIDNNGEAVDLEEAAESEGMMIAGYPQMRVVVSAASGSPEVNVRIAATVSDLGA